MTTNQFSLKINADDENAATFAQVFFETRKGLAKTFEKNFKIKFIGGIDNGIVRFECVPENEEKVRKGYAELVEGFADQQHISKRLIQTTAAKLFVLGAAAEGANDNSVSSQFVAAAAKGQPRGAYAFTPKTDGQKELVEKIRDNDVTFGIGPAGTGKTHVAIVKAVEAYKKNEITKIMLARPAVGSGKDLGALPGGIADKLAPFMRPLYDELEKVLGREQLKPLLANGIIEIAPIEYMRGRTFENAFVIVDEAQNCTKEQMRMALTRIGAGSKMVITGDPAQVDLKAGEDSGLKWAVERLEGTEGIGVQHFAASDVVRHAVVQRIVERLDGEVKVNQPVAAPKMKIAPSNG